MSPLAICSSVRNKPAWKRNIVMLAIAIKQKMHRSEVYAFIRCLR